MQTVNQDFHFNCCFEKTLSLHLSQFPISLLRLPSPWNLYSWWNIESAIIL